MAQRPKRTSRVFILVALIMILILVVIVFAFKDRIPGLASTPKPANLVSVPTAAPEVQMVDMVITSQAVARGTTFTADILTTIKYPKNNFVQGVFFSKISDVVGKKARIDLEAQIPITNSVVVDSEGGSITAFLIPKGLVAISIPMQNRIAAMSYGIQPGDHVDVITTLLYVDLDQDFQTVLPDNTAVVTAPQAGSTTTNPPVSPGLTVSIVSGKDAAAEGKAVLDPTLNQPVYLQSSESQRPRLVSQTLLQDAIVLHVGNFPTAEETSGTPGATPTPTPTPAPGGSQTAKVAVLPDIITLMVPPQDAVTLNYLVYAGAKLTLVLRSAGDDTRVQTDAVTLQYLMDKYSIPLPSKQPYGLSPRVDALIVPTQGASQYNILNP
jgi:pilus assembly protein CpaB